MREGISVNRVGEEMDEGRLPGHGPESVYETMDQESPVYPGGGEAVSREVRWDHQAIYEIIPVGASVLDLGCGSGELLSRLIKDKLVKGQGVEKDVERVMECVSRGVPVYHADLDKGLAGFPDSFFDYVVLEKTLQVVYKPLLVLEEMLRVGRAGIVSFPNFGHRDIIESFVRTGRMPITRALPYQWYDTPNIHLFTVNDFLDWARTKGVTVERGLSWADGRVRSFEKGDTLRAEEVLFVVSRLGTGKG